MSFQLVTKAESILHARLTSTTRATTLCAACCILLEQSRVPSNGSFQPGSSLQALAKRTVNAAGKHLYKILANVFAVSGSAATLEKQLII